MIAPFDRVYTDRTKRFTTGDECCVCGKHTNHKGKMVVIDHTKGQFATVETENTSGYPIGPDCAKKVKAEQPDVLIVEGGSEW